jgi:hypothetical protein
LDQTGKFLFAETVALPRLEAHFAARLENPASFIVARAVGANEGYAGFRNVMLRASR